MSGGKMTHIGIKLSLDTGTFISNAEAAKSAISDLDKEIEQAKKDGDKAKVGDLYVAKQKMMTTSEGFDRDIKALTKNPMYQQVMNKQMSGQALSKGEELFMKRLDASAAATKKLTETIQEAIKAGNTEDILKQTTDLSVQARDFHKVAAGIDNKTEGQGGTENVLKTIGLNQIAGHFNDALSSIVNSLDRSAIVNQYGSGDIMGGRISEKRRQTDLIGGLLQTGLTVGGSVLGGVLFGPGGAIAGGSAGNAAGQALNTLAHAPANLEATEAAYAGLWQNRSGQAMELAAIMGDPSKVRDAFKTAADAAAEFGYSAEEGMDAMKQAAQQGLSGEETRAVLNQSFDIERRTGADRETILGISTMAARYGAGDALGTGWQGLQASGMKPGQYNEYLRAMQRVMEDGISKGFIRSSEQVAQNLTMLSQMTDNNALWQGENGAQRLMEMNSGLERATALASSSDILAYRGAQQVVKDMSDDDWKKMVGDANGDNMADIKRSGSYIDAMILMEKGLNTDTFSEIMRLNNSAEGGDRSAVVERMKQQFGLNYFNSAMLYDQWAVKTENGTKEMSSEDTKKLLDLYGKTPPPPDSPELEAAKTTEAIKNWWTQTGISHWDDNFPKTLAEEIAKAVQEYNKKTGSNVPVPKPEELFPSIDHGAPLTLSDARAAVEEAQSNLDALKQERGGRMARGLGSTEASKALNEAKAAEITLREEINNMLINQQGTGLFTSDRNTRSKNDDEKAFSRLAAYENQPEAFQRVDEVFDIIRSLTPEQIQRANQSNSINYIIPDVMTDKTGQELLEAFRNWKITITEEAAN
jgi:alkylhydroperoxidase/carboxymuconolactone decarboxylase family protein YurZ